MHQFSKCSVQGKCVILHGLNGKCMPMGCTAFSYFIFFILWEWSMGYKEQMLMHTRSGSCTSASQVPFYLASPHWGTHCTNIRRNN